MLLSQSTRIQKLIMASTIVLSLTVGIKPLFASPIAQGRDFNVGMVAAKSSPIARNVDNLLKPMIEKLPTIIRTQVTNAISWPVPFSRPANKTELRPTQASAAKAVQPVEARTQTASRSSESRLSPDERSLLERLVEAEAGIEPYSGKLAVVTVVMNRLANGHYGKTITEVVTAPNQFSPVANGSVQKAKVSAEAVRAVTQVVDQGYRVWGPDVLWFCNPEIASSRWVIDNRVDVGAIGHHHFYR